MTSVWFPAGVEFFIRRHFVPALGPPSFLSNGYRGIIIWEWSNRSLKLTFHLCLKFVEPLFVFSLYTTIFFPTLSYSYGSCTSPLLNSIIRSVQWSQSVRGRFSFGMNSNGAWSRKDSFRNVPTSRFTKRLSKIFLLKYHNRFRTRWATRVRYGESTLFWTAWKKCNGLSQRSGSIWEGWIVMILQGPWFKKSENTYSDGKHMFYKMPCFQRQNVSCIIWRKKVLCNFGVVLIYFGYKSIVT